MKVRCHAPQLPNLAFLIRSRFTVDSQSETDAGYANESTTFARILELLSCHRLGAAVAVAENAGFFRLATLLSQANHPHIVK
jgi:hypothetical protein